MTEDRYFLSTSTDSNHLDFSSDGKYIHTSNSNNQAIYMMTAADGVVMDYSCNKTYTDPMWSPSVVRVSPYTGKVFAATKNLAGRTTPLIISYDMKCFNSTKGERMRER